MYLHENRRRKNDPPCHYYKCQLCGRINPSFNTYMNNGKPECMWICLPYRNSSSGYYLNRKEKENI